MHYDIWNPETCDVIDWSRNKTWKGDYMSFATWIMLTHLPLDKMDTISQTIITDLYSWMKVLYFYHNFTEDYF